MKIKLISITFLLLSMAFNYSYANDEDININSSEYKDAKQLSKYKNIVRRDNKKLCVKSKAKEVCFINEGSGDGKKRYSFTKLLNNNIVIVRMNGYEEYDDYFISLETGNIVLVLPPIFLGETQLSLSPNENLLIVVTTNNGYDGNPEITQVDLYELVENKQINSDSNDDGHSYSIWPRRFNIYFKDIVTGFKKYDISWLDDSTVKIQSLNSQNDYIILHQVKGSWEIKEKSYHSWSDYEYQEDN